MIERFLESVSTLLPDAPVILDLGSFTGEQAIEFAQRFPWARIFAFEALESSVVVVRKNVAAFPNIQVVEAAVCDVDGTIEFQAVEEGNAGASSLFVASGHNDVCPIRQSPVPVRALRLDTWAKSACVEHFDLVWMDLQGAELLALRGMGDMLRSVLAIQLEITYRELYQGQAMWPEVREFLESRDFQLADEWPDVSGYFGDAVFVNAKRCAWNPCVNQRPWPQFQS